MVSFSEDLDCFSLRLRVEAAPRVPRARKLRVEVGSGTVFPSALAVATNFMVAGFSVKNPSEGEKRISLKPAITPDNSLEKPSWEELEEELEELEAA